MRGRKSTPYRDPNIRGGLVGLAAHHTRAHVIRAVMEGVAFSLRDTLTILDEMSVPVEKIRVMDYFGTVHELVPGLFKIEYRCCQLLKNHVALGAVFKCRPAPGEEIERRMNEFSRKRWKSGLRPSMNAFIPSFASSEPHTCASSSMPCCNDE